MRVSALHKVIERQITAPDATPAAAAAGWVHMRYVAISVCNVDLLTHAHAQAPPAGLTNPPPPLLLVAVRSQAWPVIEYLIETLPRDQLLRNWGDSTEKAASFVTALTGAVVSPSKTAMLIEYLGGELITSTVAVDTGLGSPFEALVCSPAMPEVFNLYIDYVDCTSFQLPADVVPDLFSSAVFDALIAAGMVDLREDDADHVVISLFRADETSLGLLHAVLAYLAKTWNYMPPDNMLYKAVSLASPATVLDTLVAYGCEPWSSAFRPLIAVAIANGDVYTFEWLIDRYNVDSQFFVNSPRNCLLPHVMRDDGLARIFHHNDIRFLERLATKPVGGYPNLFVCACSELPDQSLDAGLSSLIHDAACKSASDCLYFLLSGGLAPITPFDAAEHARSVSKSLMPPGTCHDATSDAIATLVAAAEFGGTIPSRAVSTPSLRLLAKPSDFARLSTLYYDRRAGWSPARHHSFPKYVRDAVFAILVITQTWIDCPDGTRIKKYADQCWLCNLPNELVFLICKFLF
ncbi:uncharacterized protein AMSG_05717 [Thecamonas trahens ATCC 50062]|uniref:Uncharacterized protein n=1 Tax=Thecamonas trahens ATCC 50062 TaxID=461836 RepID=A0A0L0DCK0_THETB|nr:hypothetical protein AMSG_05717 [Thecamonas trahens ATCC 50062]KNC49965.1 hypothetical protein AMSG_05717 [Thecamonas trahens ATCC 50062]|eukprot:XP_013757136.1 hypothetical protein AMSG_05717 [Thecamonas trahens ATCC 50062]